MPLSEIIPFAEAFQSLAAKQLLPTSLGSAELRGLNAAIRQRSLFSARTIFEDLLGQYKSDILSILNPTQEARPDRVTPDNPLGLTTTGMDPATARLRAKQRLARRGYAPKEGQAGTLQDLSSDERINLVIRTQTEPAQNYGRFLKGQDEIVLDAWPAQELYRAEDREVPRGFERGRGGALVSNYEQSWERRWIAAGGELFDGRMIAAKDSEVWQNLGDGAGGYEDTLGNPYPPFAFNSGMDVRNVSRREAEQLGVISPGATVAPQAIDFQLPPELLSLSAGGEGRGEVAL
jgi:hypothetical protein